MRNRGVLDQSTAISFSPPMRVFDESAMTLIGGLIALGLFSTVIALTVLGYNNLIYARRTVEASNAVREADELVTTMATKALQNFVRGGCTGTVNAAPISLGAQFGTMMLSRSVARDFRKDPKLPPSFDLAISRCAGAATGGLHGCFDIAKATTARPNASHSFAGAKAAFIEYFATVHDFKANTTVSCSAASSSTTGGLTLHYGIYLIMNSNQGNVYKVKTGVLYSNVL